MSAPSTFDILACTGVPSPEIHRWGKLPGGLFADLTVDGKILGSIDNAANSSYLTDDQWRAFVRLSASAPILLWALSNVSLHLEAFLEKGQDIDWHHLRDHVAWAIEQVGDFPAKP